MNSYATPSISFEVEVLDIEGKKLVVLSVDEFTDIPILCRKEYQVSKSQKGGDRRPRFGAGRVMCGVAISPKQPKSAPKRKCVNSSIWRLEKGSTNSPHAARKAGLLPAAWQPESKDEDPFTQQIEDMS